MKHKTKVLLSLVCTVSLFLSFSLAVQAKPGKSAAHRFYGKDRFQTSTSIASALDEDQKVQNIVLASAYNYSDALSASTLAYQLKAPIILVSPGYKDSLICYDYVKNYLAAGGTVTIVGGNGIISHGSEQWLINNGFHVRRLGGNDRFDTNALIVNQLNVPQGTPVIIASGMDFPDALGVSSLAASKGWPILLSNPSNLTQSVKDFLASDKPTYVYVIGGEGIINNGVTNQIQTISPNSQIQRLGGYDRFETLSLILNKFYPDPTEIYIANGYDFADALSGSTLAATHDAPILLVDPKSNTLPKSIYDYLVTLRNNNVQPQVNVLGGEAAVPQRLIDQINNILESTGQTTTPPINRSETFTVSNSSTNGFTVAVNPALTGLKREDFRLFNSSGNPVTINSVASFNGGSTYVLNASLNIGEVYSLTAVKTGYTFGTAQFAPTTTYSETLTVFNPSTTGFRVGISPAISNMTANNFTLLNSSGNPVTITGLTALNDGAAYDIKAPLNVGQTYTLTANVTGYTFGTVQFIPATTVSETLTMFNPSITGFRVGVNPALSNMTASNFTLLNSSGNPVTITSVSSLNGGATYDIKAPLNLGQTYTLTANVTGYTFGTVQFIPATTVSETLTMFNPSTTGFRVGVNPALWNMTASNFTLLNSSGNPVTITGVTALNGGATYDIKASLNAGQTYTLTANVTGYTFGTVQLIPAATVSEMLSVLNPSTTGFRVGVNPAISNMNVNDFALFDGSGNPVTLTSVTVLDDGATYEIKASLSAGQIYKLTAAKTGYVFGTAQFIPTIS